MSFLYDQIGKRKYLTIEERHAFLDSAKSLDPEVYTFCATLAFTGARISEVLALTPDRIDFTDRLIIVESLKKRKRNVFRAIPIPKDLLNVLDDVHNICQLKQNSLQAHLRIWPWCRTTAWKNVKVCMMNAGIIGPQACPKGLRHSFGVASLQTDVPLNMVRKWLGHARLSTTSIYVDAVGTEEREIAVRFWKTFER